MLIRLKFKVILPNCMKGSEKSITFSRSYVIVKPAKPISAF